MGGSKAGSFEEMSKLDYQLQNMRKMRYSVIFLLTCLIPNVYCVFGQQDNFYQPSDGARFDFVFDGFASFGRFFCLLVILYQSWIPPERCCFRRANLIPDAPLLRINDQVTTDRRTS